MAVRPVSMVEMPSATPATTTQSRRSLIVMANSLKPTRQKLSKYFSRSRHSTPEPDVKDWDAQHLSSAIKMASMQMGRLGNPEHPISPVVRDSRYKPTLVRVSTIAETERELQSSTAEPLVATPPPPPQQSPPPIPEPDRLAPRIPMFTPPAPIAPFFEEIAEEPQLTYIRRGPSLIQPRPVHPRIRRRAKTPVHKIGQLEMAAAKKRQDAVLSRNSSIRTIARQYRALVAETDIPEVPPLSTIQRKPLPETASPVVPEFDDNFGPIPRQSIIVSPGAGLFESPRPRSEAISEADTLLPLPADEQSMYLKPLANCAAPPTPPSEHDEECLGHDNAKSADTDTDALRFQIGFELLTRELSTAFAQHSARGGDGRRDTSGLQIYVMIEAYERLRDQIGAMETQDPELKNAMAMFDAWLASLRAIQRSMADEEVVSESEYEDNDVESQV